MNSESSISPVYNIERDEEKYWCHPSVPLEYLRKYDPKQPPNVRYLRHRFGQTINIKQLDGTASILVEQTIEGIEVSHFCRHL